MQHYNHLPETKRDEMTGLPNKLALHEALETAITTHSGSFALMKVDIFGFKPINDEFGHEEGDEFIRIVAEVLDELLRSNDLHFPAREQGDEFAVILYGITSKEQLDLVSERVKAELEEEYGIRISVGGCLHAEDIGAKQLQALADACMRDNRRRGKLEQYGNNPDRAAAIHQIAQLALYHSINPRDMPTLIELVERGDI